MLSMTNGMFLIWSSIPIVFGFFKNSIFNLKDFIGRKSDHQVKSNEDNMDIPLLRDQPPLKVLLAVEPTPFTYISGYSNRFKEMLDHLKLAGDKVYIFTPDSGTRSPPPNEYADFPIVTVRGWELPMYKQVTVSFDSRFRLKSMIMEFKPDLIHCASPSAVIWFTALWARIFRLPLVLSYHTDFVAYARYYARKLNYFGAMEKLAKFLVILLHQHADMTLCTSPQLRDSLLELGLKNVDVWRKGINTKIFSPTFRNATMREKLSDGNPNDPLLVYVGRLGKEKRLDRLKSVLDAIPGARLALVGGGPAESELKELFKDYPVHFAGSMTGDSLSQAFASCDIFVMPSDSETLGFVVLEGYASGIPVVGVAAGGLVDIINDGENGYIVENNEDMIQFSARTKELIDDVAKRQQMGKQARAYAELWSWESATSYLRNVQYRRAMQIHKDRMIKEEGPQDAEAIDKAVACRGLMFRPDLA